MSPEVQMVLAAVSGYLVGSISFALVIGALKGVDIRTVGSGNPGATNVKRALGRGAGNLVWALPLGLYSPGFTPRGVNSGSRRSFPFLVPFPSFSLLLSPFPLSPLSPLPPLLLLLLSASGVDEVGWESK